MNAVDTNILLYVHDPRDPDKQAIAASVIQSLIDGVLPWQVAYEYLAAARKLEPIGYDRSEAWQDIRNLGRIWEKVFPTWEALDLAEQLLNNYSLSFWDSMIIAACLEAGVTRLYSEDFDAYPRVNGLEIVNPFKVLPK